jgi:DNA-binding transcriptional LysR family regulator
MRSMIDRIFETRGWTLRACTVDRLSAMKELVKTGMGVAALPKHFVAAEVRSRRLRRLPANGLDLRMEITAAWRKAEDSERWVGAALRAASDAVRQSLAPDARRIRPRRPSRA